MTSIVETFSNVAYTEKGAVSYATTGSNCVNLFFKAVRNIEENLLINLLEKAWEESPRDTMKLIFQSRDCRGGKGERALFYQGLDWVAQHYPEAFYKNLPHVPEYGTWKDLLKLGAKYEVALKIFALQLEEDYNNMLQGKPITLAGKWAPTEGCADDKNWGAVSLLANLLGLNKKEYRKKISEMRAYLQVIERYLCSKRWDEIDYQKVPSVAMFRLRNAFCRHDGERFEAYLEAVRAGRANIKAGQLFPHELVGYYLQGGQSDLVIDLQWATLVQQVLDSGTLKGVIPICDVSGSMSGLPMFVSVALGVLISQVAEEEWKDLVITFSENPKFHHLEGGNLQSKVERLKNAPWGGTTNFESAFRLILERARELNLPQEKMPKRLICLSDMEFDAASGRKTNFEQIKALYRYNGYEMPQIIFWNLASRTIQFPATEEHSNVALVSGFSPSILQALVEEGEISPYGIMRKVIDAPRYAKIAVDEAL